MADRHGTVVRLEISVYEEETAEELGIWIAGRFDVSVVVDHEQGNAGPTFIVYGAPSKVGAVIEWYGSPNPEQPPWIQERVRENGASYVDH